jgi:hypothetical protein
MDEEVDEFAWVSEEKRKSIQKWPSEWRKKYSLTKSSHKSQESIDSPKTLIKKAKKKLLKSKKEIQLHSRLLEMPAESMKSLETNLPPMFTLSQSAHDS